MRLPAERGRPGVHAVAPGDVDDPTAGLADALADGCLSVSAAAAFAGVSRTTLYELMRAHGLPTVKVGRRRLVPKRGLVDWLRARADRAG